MAQSVSAVITDTSRSAHAQLRPVAVNAVDLTDAFWAPRRAINAASTLLSQYKQCEDTGRFDNFRRVAGTKDVPFQGIYFNDSDVYKWLEAACWTLATEENAALSVMVDEVVELIIAAQHPDGYINTYYSLERAAERWSNLKDMHELYCAGHLIQAAVAHRRATGSDRLLSAVCHFVELIGKNFGPATAGKREFADGHPEIEMALVELYRLTGEKSHLKLAQFFVDSRGNGGLGGSHYLQDHQPFRALNAITGHAVRAVYLTAGATDVVAETGDEALLGSLQRQWDNMSGRRMYVTGGIGSRYEGEAFGEDYELPNGRAYTETCAAIGSFMWNWRMLQFAGDARYADLMESTLYNAVMCGLSLDGQHYFYQNPLANDGSHRRQPWFGCACCPPNIARILAQLPGYFYTTSSNAIWVHLFADSTAHLTLDDGRGVELRQHTAYPWDGAVEIEVLGEGNFTVHVRIPAWAGQAGLAVNGVAQPSHAPGYAAIRRSWQSGDRIHLTLPFEVQAIASHPYIADNTGRVAIMRGPLLYALEQADNPGVELRDVVLPSQAPWEARHDGALLGGVTTLTTTASIHRPAACFNASQAYAPAPAAAVPAGEVQVTAIPYYAWANREAGSMAVWIRTSA